MESDIKNVKYILHYSKYQESNMSVADYCRLNNLDYLDFVKFVNKWEDIHGNRIVETCMERPDVLPYTPEEFEKRHLDASLAAGILTNKYHYHIPYERQLNMLNNGEIKLAKTTMFEYGKAGIDALDGLYEAIREKVLSDNRCHIDETVQHVVDKENHRETDLVRKSFKFHAWLTSVASFTTV